MTQPHIHSLTLAGLSAIINDDLAETALNLVSFVVALLTAVVGYIYGVMFLGASSGTCYWTNKHGRVPLVVDRYRA